MSQKKSKWSKKYKNDGYSTAINRLIKGDSVENGIKNYKKVLYLPNTQRNVAIVINFISKQTLEDNIKLYKEENKGKFKDQIIQLVWFISSLISSCIEVGVNVNIYCREKDPEK